MGRRTPLPWSRTTVSLGDWLGAGKEISNELQSRTETEWHRGVGVWERVRMGAVSRAVVTAEAIGSRFGTPGGKPSRLQCLCLTGSFRSGAGGKAVGWQPPHQSSPWAASTGEAGHRGIRKSAPLGPASQVAGETALSRVTPRRVFTKVMQVSSPFQLLYERGWYLTHTTGFWNSQKVFPAAGVC